MVYLVWCTWYGVLGMVYLVWYTWYGVLSMVYLVWCTWYGVLGMVYLENIKEFFLIYISKESTQRDHLLSCSW